MRKGSDRKKFAREREREGKREKERERERKREKERKRERKREKEREREIKREKENEYHQRLQFVKIEKNREGSGNVKRKIYLLKSHE